MTKRELQPPPHLGKAPALKEHLGHWPRGFCDSDRVSQLLKDRNSLLGYLQRLVTRALGPAENPHIGSLNERARLEASLVSSASALESLGSKSLGPGVLAALPKRLRYIGRNFEPQAFIWLEQRLSAGEQAVGGSHVVASERTPAGIREPLGPPSGECERLLVRRPEVAPVAIGPLEVVAQDLLVLTHSLSRCRLQPAGKTLVKLGSSPLWDRVVGGVTYEDVAEPEGVVAGEVRAGWADQFFPLER